MVGLQPQSLAREARLTCDSPFYLFPFSYRRLAASVVLKAKQTSVVTCTADGQADFLLRRFSGRAKKMAKVPIFAHLKDPS